MGINRRSVEELANAQDRQKLRLENTGLRAIRSSLRRMNVAVNESFLAGRDPLIAFRLHLPEIRDILTQSMVVTHLEAHRRALLQAVPKIRTNQKLAGTAYDESIDFLKARLLLSDEDIEALSIQYGPTATQQISQMSDRGNTEIQKAMLNLSSRNIHGPDGLGTLRKAMKNAGMSTQPWAVETVFRTNTAIAYSAGRVNANSDPAIQEILWGYEYVTVGDDRVRPNHQAMDGTRAAKDDPFWKANMPPNGWNCRCVAIELFDDNNTPKLPDDVVTLPDGTVTSPIADRGWSFNPGDLYHDYLRRVVA